MHVAAPDSDVGNRLAAAVARQPAAERVMNLEVLQHEPVAAGADDHAAAGNVTHLEIAQRHAGGADHDAVAVGVGWRQIAAFPAAIDDRPLFALSADPRRARRRPETRRVHARMDDDGIAAFGLRRGLCQRPEREPRAYMQFCH
jgi:hypothetical protein